MTEDHELRVKALELAVEKLKGTPGANAEFVAQMAKTFYEFLKSK